MIDVIKRKMVYGDMAPMHEEVIYICDKCGREIEPDDLASIDTPDRIYQLHLDCVGSFINDRFVDVGLEMKLEVKYVD